MNIFKKEAIAAAKESGLFIKRSVGRIKNISYKGRDNIVTDVDKKAESIIMKRIFSAFPGHSILSEETGLRMSPSLYRWVIDPLDGTTNFAHAFPFFCVSIALEYDGEVMLGVVFDPVRNELFTAEKGKGAYLNSDKIKVSGIGKLSKSFVATGFSYGNKRKDRNVKYFKRLLMKTMAIRRAGSAALDLCYVACGRFDGYWELDLHPWDSAAGSLIVKEAGGKVTKFDGKPHSDYEKQILATNSLIHKEMVKTLNS
ncbi:MAG TPA: inositol monophosphatase family protein [Candidatus Omnitrophota bacterium]|nr:inositol monophosphatase family protein [Candidatus Omnitrophota bacterium]